MDSLARFEKILALLEAHPEGLTGRELAEYCGVPWHIMRDDLMTICSSEQNLPIYTEHDADELCDRDGDEETGIDAKEEATIFRPEERWFITSRRINGPVHLTPDDAVNILHILNFQVGANFIGRNIKQKLLGHIALAPDPLFFIKGDMEPLPLEQPFLPKLEAALLRLQTIEIEYKGKKRMVDPLGLVYYSRLRFWYLVARDNGIVKTYGLAKLQDVHLTGRRYLYPKDFSLKDWFRPHWGMEFGDGYFVKVRFANRAQTFDKVRKDVAHRQVSLYEESGYLIFEDYIIGKNEFLAWLLGFGSAAEVLQPAELRQEMKRRLKEALGRYHRNM